MEESSIVFLIISLVVLSSFSILQIIFRCYRQHTTEEYFCGSDRPLLCFRCCNCFRKRRPVHPEEPPIPYSQVQQNVPSPYYPLPHNPNYILPVHSISLGHSRGAPQPCIFVTVSSDISPPSYEEATSMSTVIR